MISKDELLGLAQRKREVVNIDAVGRSVEIVELSLAVRSALMPLYEEKRYGDAAAMILRGGVLALKDATDEELDNLATEFVEEVTAAVLRLSGMAGDGAKKN